MSQVKTQRKNVWTRSKEIWPLLTVIICQFNLSFSFLPCNMRTGLSGGLSPEVFILIHHVMEAGCRQRWFPVVPPLPALASCFSIKRESIPLFSRALASWLALTNRKWRRCGPVSSPAFKRICCFCLWVASCHAEWKVRVVGEQWETTRGDRGHWGALRSQICGWEVRYVVAAFLEVQAQPPGQMKAASCVSDGGAEEPLSQHLLLLFSNPQNHEK